MNRLVVPLALVLTLAMLYIARRNSLGQPEEITGEIQGIRLSMVTVPKVYEFSDTTVTVTLKGLPPGAQVRLCVSEDPEAPLSDWSCSPMRELGADTGGYRFGGTVTGGARGGRLYYYFAVADSTGAVLARLTDPRHRNQERPFSIRYFGHVPPVILGGHLLFIFATVFFVSLATVNGWRAWRDESHLGGMMVWLLWATVTSFIGMIVFGVPMNYYAFGGYWEGVPFGHDATDNKTQLLFVYLLFATLSGLGSLTGSPRLRDVFAPRTLAGVGIGSFVVMLFIYLIPHSIQFSPAVTYAFCYSWIGLLLVVYVWAWIRLRRRTVRV